MDLGSLVCTRSNPNCVKCPLINECKAFKNDQIALYPQPNKKTKQIKKTYHLLLLTHNNQILLNKRNGTGIWPELWFLPLFDTEQELLANNTIQLNHEKCATNFNIQHILSHRKLDLQVHCFQNNTIIDKYYSNNYKWIDISQYQKMPHPTALEKIIHYFLAHEDI